MIEGKWNAVNPQSFTANGTAFGVVTVADTAGFKTKQSAYLQSGSLPNLAVQVKRVLSPTRLIVGAIDNKIASWTPLDISGYIVGEGAQIGAESQNKNNIPWEDHYRAIYESDPIIADRVIFVDQYGQFYNNSNPLPIIFDGTVTVGNVQVTNFPTTVDTNYGNVGSSTLRTAAQIGNATGAAAFGAGATTAQVLRVVLPTDQSAIPVTQSGVWTTGRTWTLASGTDSVTSFQGGAWTTGRTWTLSSSTDSIASVQSGAWNVNSTNFPTTVDTNYGVVGASTIRTAAQIGNATGAANFGAGATGAQTLRVSANITRNGNELDYNYGATSANTLRTASQIGNSTGTADFNEGANSAQTLRVSANIARNGNELSYNSGASDSNTLRSAVNLKREGNELDYNYGVIGVNSLRIASQVGNATGSADFGAGATGTQTLRVASNLYDSAANGLTSTLLSGKRALDVNIANDTFQVDVGTPDESAFTYGTSIQQPVGGVYQDTSPGLTAGQSGAVRLTQNRAFHTNLRNVSGTELDYNFGVASAATLRASALIGNSTGAADFNAGVTGAQTLRVSANITRNGTELSYNDGSSDANTLRSSSNLKRQGNELDYNFGTASANSLRVASLIGNATGSADFSAGVTGIQTVRVSANITRNGTELSYGTGAIDADTLRIAAILGNSIGEIAYNYGVVNAQTIRTAAQIGNATGSADFNAGITGAQTPRTTANITRNGTELSYNSGASDANTLRSVVNLKREGNDLDYNFGAASANSLRIASLIGNATGSADFNYGTIGAQSLRVAAQLGNAAGSIDYNFGTVGAQTIRTASQVGNTTGSADFGAGVTGAQTLRTTSNITRNGTELSYNSGVSDANTLRSAVNLKREGNDLDYNFGAASTNSLRIAALIGNATGAADFNAGSATAQTLRVTAANFPTTVDTNYGTVGASTLRTASQIGNSTGAANFNAGVTGAQTLRVVANLNDGSANAITSTLINAKQRLDVDLASEGQAGSAVPFLVMQVGSKDTDGNLQPLSLGEVNELNIGIQDDQTGDYANVTHRRELRTADALHLIGDSQEGAALDTNVWVSTLVGTGSITVANNLAQLSTGTTANSSSFLASIKKARFITGTINSFFAGIRLGDTGVANNVRRWGAYDANNGVFFQLNGTVFGIGIRQTAVDNIITVFNGPNAPVVDTNFHTYEIDYSSGIAQFFQDNKLIHTFNTTTAALADTLHFLLGFQNTNSGGGTSNVSMYVRGSSVMRFGVANARPIFSHITVAATTVLKTSPGTLHRITLNSLGTGTASMTLYDNTAASGTIIAVIGMTNQQATYEYNVDFSIGLTIVKTAATGDATVIYD